MHPLNTSFSKYAGWNVLQWFTAHPYEEIHVNRLSRELGIGTGTSSRLLRELLETGLLHRREVANASLYSLDNESGTVRELKRLRTVMELESGGVVESFLRHDDAIITLALYGSYASGENDARSDVDILLISGSNGEDYPAALKNVEKALGGEASLLKFSLTSWRKLKTDDPDFYGTVIANHVVLWGSQLP
jgi:predicted nucleotidyltransferase